MAMRNSNNQSTRYMSTLQENYIAKKFGGKVCPNSGAGKWQKSDVVVNRANMSIECKTSMTAKNSFTIKKDWIEKHRNEAFSNRLSNTAIAISFDPSGTENYFIISEKLMAYLIESLSLDSDID